MYWIPITLIVIMCIICMIHNAVLIYVMSGSGCLINLILLQMY